MTPADTMHAAATRLRERATAATPGPWTQTGIGEYGWSVSFHRNSAGVETEDTAQGRADADYIAAMHPGVGRTLADWLDSAAEDAVQIGPDHHALALARQILGEATS